MSEERVNVTINIRTDLYEKLKEHSAKNLYVPSVENMITYILDEWDNREQNV